MSTGSSDANHEFEYDTTPREAGGKTGCCICGKESRHPIHRTSNKSNVVVVAIPTAAEYEQAREAFTNRFNHPALTDSEDLWVHGYSLALAERRSNETEERLRVRLAKDIYDDGQDHHPPSYVGRKGDVVVIHSIQTAVVSHRGTGGGFVVHDGELELSGSQKASESRVAYNSNGDAYLAEPPPSSEPEQR